MSDELRSGAQDGAEEPLPEVPAASPLQTGFTVLALIAAGAFVWQLQLREPLSVDASRLDTIPIDLAGWDGHEVPVESTVERMLRADHHVQRSYHHAAGGTLWVYVGYYGTERGGRSEHSPFVCYPSAGWSVLEEHTDVVDAELDRKVREIVVERDGERRLVHFWYRTHRSTGLVGSFEHAVDRLIGRLTAGRGDGAFVRVSTPMLGRDIAQARQLLLGFGAELDRSLAERWPDEVRVSRVAERQLPDSGARPAAGSMPHENRG